MKTLPYGWVHSSIGNLCTLNNGRAFKPTEWSVSGLPIVRIQNLNKTTAMFNYFDGDFDSKYHLKGGELLFAWSGTPGTSFGAHVWRGGEAVLNQHIFRVDFNESFLDKRFFRHAINQTLGELIDIAHGGVGLRHVTKGKFENTKIALPPCQEQKRIADKLDTVLARVDVCRERLNRVPLILKRFRQSVLNSAFCGELTRDWRVNSSQTPVDINAVVDALFSDGVTVGNFGKRADRPSQILNDEVALIINNDCGWPLVRIGAICGCVVPNRDKPKSFSGSYHWLLTPHFHDEKITFDYSKIEHGLSKEEIVKYCAKIIPIRSVVMSCVGRLALSAVLEEESVINQQLHAFLPSMYVLPEFLAYVIRANRKYYEAISTSTTVSYLNKTACNSLPIPLPHVEEQAEVIRRIETLFDFANRLEARLVAARAATDRLTPALLAKAFRGELVPQDPDDEPATELLKRLAAAREPAAKSKHGDKSASTAAAQT
jgi:type I restriction enzyme, S subunit